MKFAFSRSVAVTQGRGIEVCSRKGFRKDSIVKLTRHSLALSLVLLLLPVRAIAADLVDVYHLAQQYNARFQSAQRSLDAAKPRSRQAYARVLPTLSVTGSYDRSNTSEEYIGAPNDIESTTTVRGGRLRLSIPLFDREAWLDVAKSKSAYVIAELEFELFKQDFIIQVAQAYFSVLTAEDNLSSAVANRRQIAEQLSTATRNYEAGITVITDKSDAQSRFDLAVAEEIASKNDLNLARLALENITGEANLNLKKLPEDLDLNLVTREEVAKWLEHITHHPSVLLREKEYEIAQLNIKQARAARLPTLTAVADYAVDRNSNDNALVPIASDTHSAQLQFSMPLFTGFSATNRIREYHHLGLRARADKVAEERLVSEQARRASLELQSLEARIKALSAAVESSRLSLRAATLGYRTGVRTNLDVLDAQAQLFNAQRDLAQSRYDIFITVLSLRESVGLLSADDLVQVNRLLVE